MIKVFKIKKILPSRKNLKRKISFGIIPLLVLAIFLMPISPSIGLKKDGQVAVGVKTNEALALAETLSIEKNIINDSGATFNIIVGNTTTGYLDDGITYTLYDKVWDVSNQQKKPAGVTVLEKGIVPVKENTQTQSIPLTLGSLKPQTEYFLTTTLMKGHTSITLAAPYIERTISSITSTNITFTTSTDSTSGNGNINNATSSSSQGSDGEYGCGLSPATWFSNCIALLLYKVVFYPVSKITHVAARILDFFIYYSTNSDSYTSDFVKNGWAAVRDIANIFFIIALLYIALKTILGIGHGGEKKIIGYIVLFALLINFSLFITEVVIDGSNILAKVFYNNITSVDGNGNKLKASDEGEKSITVGLVKQFNPHEILGNDVSNQISEFIFVTILAILLMCFMIYIFISVALLFIGRVVALWLSMIFAPIAFASYTLPFDIPGLGHKEWWSELFKNAFLAPIFIFLLYIIAMFGNFMNIISYDVANSDWTGGVMKTIIPFAIIFILLIKAKEMAVKYAGEMGKAVVKGGAVLGGLALGAAAMTTAAVGRGTIGSFMKGASTGDTAARRIAAEKASGVKDPSIKWGTRVKGFAQKYTMIDLAQRGTAKWINKGQDKLEESKHARHELDSAADGIVKGAKWNDLTGDQRYLARRSMARDRIIRENSAKQGLAGLDTPFGTRKWDKMSEKERNAVDAAIKPTLDTNTTWEDLHYVREARRKQGLGVSLKQSMVTGTFDARNLSKVVAEQQDSMLNKFASGLTSALGSAIRGSIKGTLGSQYGTGQGKFFKDLGETISEAMKGAKINVDLSHLGKEEKEGHKEKGGGGHH